MGRYALESAAKILHYYNDYFGVPYPLPKLDLIAIPGGFGARWRIGAGITYYESVLLSRSEEIPRPKRKQAIFAVVAHEMARINGSAISLRWRGRDNLWLNEGFASWMGSKCRSF